jgi:hypothetical protein
MILRESTDQDLCFHSNHYGDYYLQRSDTLVEIYQCFRGTCCLHLQGRKLFYSENGDRKFLRNTDKYLADYMTSYSKNNNLLCAKQTGKPISTAFNTAVRCFKYSERNVHITNHI